MKTIKSIAELDAVRDYLSRVGASVRSLRTAVVEQRKGKYWTDVAIIRFSTKGEVTTDPAYEPTEAEQDAIKVAFAGVVMPEHVHPAALPSIPEEVQALIDEGRRDELYEFRDLEGNFVMFQYKAEKADGEKVYIPWTYWNDGQWRKMEPEEKLPIFNIEKAKGATTVFLHEGAKGAKIIQDMIERKTPKAREMYEAHPWAEELATGIHVGWIGGALNPARTDWKQLKKCGVKRVIIVADNDTPGKVAIPKIAYYLHVPTFSIEFSNDFPNGFDLGDQFPENMFDWSEEEGRKVYTGNPLTSYLHNATWATNVKPGPNNKPIIELREHFRDMWAYAEQHELFVNKIFTNMRYTEAQINAVLAPFYHGKNIAKMILKDYTGRTVRFAYRPDTPERVITNYDQTSINLHTPGSIRPAQGSTKPWEEFLAYLIPNEKDRKLVERWCATLIARPEIKMGYAMLLMSEAQGVGKTTLANAVLEPIVGRHNTDQTSERDIVESQFTDWIAEKRLVVVNEIYSGHSWKAYHKLKTFITDSEVKVNKKFQTPYTVENWAHIFACSNSKSALRMDDDDRRWLCPEVTEMPWPRERFNRFYRWLKGPGLGIIMRWAMEYGDYVATGERAPMTQAKADLIVESLTDAGKALRDVALAAVEDTRPLAFTMTDLVRWVKEDRTIRVVETEHELRKPLKAAGLRQLEKKIGVDGRAVRVLYNPAAVQLARAVDRGEPGALAELRKIVTRPQDLLPTEF